MFCHFGIIEGHVVQLKEMCSPNEGARSTIGPLCPPPPQNNCPSLLEEYPRGPLYAIG